MIDTDSRDFHLSSHNLHPLDYLDWPSAISGFRLRSSVTSRACINVWAGKKKKKKKRKQNLPTVSPSSSSCLPEAGFGCLNLCSQLRQRQGFLRSLPNKDKTSTLLCCECKFMAGAGWRRNISPRKTIRKNLLMMNMFVGIKDKLSVR